MAYTGLVLTVARVTFASSCGTCASGPERWRGGEIVGGKGWGLAPRCSTDAWKLVSTGAPSYHTAARQRASRDAAGQPCAGDTVKTSFTDLRNHVTLNEVT